ncbi:MAG TPA: hypothetical protein VK324_14835, partial [Tepidisphaeraceae bacterium]|nr:hypothetical protein [Tepidisphaeraceae bacterium]
MADPAVYQHIDDPPPTTPDELAARFERMSGGPPPHRADESWWNFAVRLRETGLAVGRLEATIVGGRAEVAYLFGQA